MRTQHLRFIGTLVAFGLGVLCSQDAAAQLDELTLAKRQETFLLERFRTSMIGTTTYVGVGSLVNDSYSDNPLVIQSFDILPRFTLAPAQTLRLRWILECELTEPDRNPARACNPSDLRLSYHHVNILQDPWINGQMVGWTGLYFPISYESQQNSTVLNWRTSLGYVVRFFGDRLLLEYDFAFQKYFPTRKERVSCPTESDGSGVPLCLPTTTTPNQGSAQSGSAGSGGVMNDNWLFLNSFYIQYSFSRRWWAGLFFEIQNYIAYSVDSDTLTNGDLPSVGEDAWTRGDVSLSFQPIEHLVFALGISSYQPAFTSDNDSVRFPFYDFVSPSNNYTRWYFDIRGIY